MNEDALFPDLYDGPIIDAHHHLWDLSLQRHPWLLGTDDTARALGDLTYLRHDYLIPNLLADSAGQNIVGSVHVEALWDRTRDAVEETAWLDTLARPQGPDTLARPQGIAGRCIAHVPLAHPDAAAMLERHAAFPRVAGVRETIRWHPDPAKRWAEDRLVEGIAWRRGLAHLARRGWLLELLMNPHQATQVADLAAAFPEQTIVVNHCASPGDRDAAGIARWHDGLARMAAQPNVAIKISNASAYAADTSDAALSAVILPCLEAFGPQRTLFGTDYPVARRTMTYGAICDAVRRILRPLSPADQRAVFHDNAARLYRFDTSE